MFNRLKRRQIYKYLLLPFSHESDCYKIKTGKCILKMFSRYQILSLPSFKSPNGKSYLITDIEKLKLYRDSKNSSTIQTLIDYINNSNSKHRCLETAYSILKNEYDDNSTYDKIDVQLYPDGHYKMENGRHRFCIASKLKIPMVAHFKAIGLFDDSGFIE